MCRSRSIGIFVVLTVLWVACFAAPAAAEWIVDVYGGGSFINSPNVSITKNTAMADMSTMSIDATLKSVNIDSFFMGGLRLGYWFDTRAQLFGFDLGLGLDMFYYPLRVPSQMVDASANTDLEVTVGNERFVLAAGENQPVKLPNINVDDSAVIAPEFLLRQSFLANTDFPHGRLQPYISIAPAFLFTDHDANRSVGVKGGIGLAWQFHKHLAILAEYRFTHVPFETRDGSLLVANTVIRDPKITADLNTHFIVAGISFRFK